MTTSRLSSRPTFPVDAMSARLDDVVDRAVEGGRIVGTVLLVARAGQVVYRRAAGLANRESGRALRPDAIFLLSSVTKPIVSLAALRLVEAGLLRLDDPITRWLPGFRPRLADGAEPAITVHQLLTHTAGLIYPGNAEHGQSWRDAGVSSGLDGRFTSLEDNLRRVASLPLVAAPGERWIYSLAIDVLGAVIEAVTRQPLAQALRDLVLAPLGMSDSDFAVVDRDRLVTHYADGDAGPIVMPGRHRAVHDGVFFDFAPDRIFDASAYPSAGGGMAGTADDVLRALEAIRIGHPAVVSAAGAALMRRAHVGADAQTQGPGWGFGYGGALLVDPTAAGSAQSPGTMQWGGVYGHTWFVDPARELTVVALTNTSLEGLFGLYPAAVRDAVYGTWRARRPRAATAARPAGGCRG